MNEFQIFRDGKPVSDRYPTFESAMHRLHKLHPQSADWAMRHDGYEISEVPHDDEPSPDAMHHEGSEED